MSRRTQTVSRNRVRRVQSSVTRGMVSLVLAVASQPLWAQGKYVTDNEITTAVKTELRQDSAIPANRIDVETKDGIVILGGSVDNILAKERARRIAEAVVGVRSVINDIDVKPAVARSNSELRSAVERALRGDPATASYKVQARADDGIVILTGTVDDWQQKRLCKVVAEGVKGVRDVKDNITVEIKVHRSDAEIRQEIKDRLANDVRVDDALVKVAVHDGNVTLSGIVASAQEKNRAEVDARVGGVENVNAEGLKVRWEARDKMRRTDLYTSRTDAQIKQAIEDAFIYDPRVYPSDVKVDVTDGDVLLSGTVDNLMAKTAAGRDASNTTGVKSVRNTIKVRPAVIPADQDLEDRVSKALIENPYVERYRLHVSASDGTVFLSGKVHTSWEKALAETVAESVKGTVTVVNNIKSARQWTWKPDAQIRRDVEDQLRWSPFVDSNDITVTVNNGIVTLNGTVATYSARQDAEDDAYEGGAKEVVNNLQITYPYRGPHRERLYSAPYAFDSWDSERRPYAETTDVFVIGQVDEKIFESVKLRASH